MENFFKTILNLIQNLTILFSLVFIYTFINPKLKKINRISQKIILGIVFGLIAIVSMQVKISEVSGIIGRFEIPCVAGIFFGPLPAIITAVLSGISRYIIGGVGMLPGLGVIVTSALTGILIHKIWKKKVFHFKIIIFSGIGLILVVQGLLWALLIPHFWDIVHQILFSFIFFYPIDLALLCFLIVYQSKREFLEKRFETIFNKINDAVFIHEESSGIVVDVNETMLKMYGYSSKDEIIGKKIDVFSADEKEYTQEEALQKISLEQTAPFYWHAKKKNGDLFWVEVSLKKIVLSEEVYVIAVVRDISQRKETEEVLKTEKELNEILIQSSPSFFVAIGSDGRVIKINQSMLNSLGYSESEVIGKDYLSLFVPNQDQIILKEIFKQIIDERKNTINVSRVLAKDGHVLVCEWHGIPVFHGQKYDFFLGVGIDITEREKAVEDFIKKEAQIKTLIDTIPDLVWLKDENGVYLECNHRFEDFFGAKKEDIIGKTDYDFVDKALADFFRNKDRIAMEMGKPSINEEEIVFASDGHKEILETIKTPVYGKNGQLMGVLGIGRNISERKEKEVQIKELNETLEQKVIERTAQLEAANEELDTSNQILIKNNIELEKAYDSLKTAQEKIIESAKMAALGNLIAGIAHEMNTPLGAIVSSGNMVLDSLEKATDLVYFDSLHLSEKEKKYFEILRKKALSFDFSEENTKDFRKRKKMLTRLLESKNIMEKELAEFLCEIGYSGEEEILDSLFDSKNYQKIIEMAYNLSHISMSSKIIQMASEKASKVVFALKTYSHHQNNEPLQKTDLKNSIETVLTLYHSQYKYRVEVVRNYEENLKVLSYPEKLNQVWINLLNNALQAMKYQGKIEIGIQTKNGQALVSFEDNGPGISKEIKNKIFEPFFTTKKAGEGTGLGLDICRKIVEEIGGKIDFESVPGKTVFYIYLKSED
ncbi:MAG TPA: hypothetical protein DHW82_09880 [Spirochaetia bacterium]|nr:MAG: hypothetical protein A2Y41_10370 [Spirochaetes bacterium GWB1_36_13]HCL57300.1 hypothetical protein [Spirochaetia bacterium]